LVEQKSKKFVFNVDQENVSFVESLSYEQKNELINKLLTDYQDFSAKEEKGKNLIAFFKKIVIFLFIALIGTPLFIMSVNFFFDHTLNSYSQMERNFERLFNGQ